MRKSPKFFHDFPAGKVTLISFLKKADMRSVREFARRLGLLSIVFGAAIGRVCCAAEDISPFAQHPAAKELERVFSSAQASEKSAPSGITKHDYLSLIAGNVDFFKQYQNAAGAIIDPYKKEEVQYSTPAFAVAAAILATEAGRKDLIEPATGPELLDHGGVLVNHSPPTAIT